MLVPKLKALWRRTAAPLIEASPKKRMKWLLLTAVFSAAAVGAECWFYDNYRIAWDRQILRCIGPRFLLIDLNDKALQRDALYAYESRQAAPLIQNGATVGKYLRVLPGDLVEVRRDNTVWINGEKVAEGMPHLAGLTESQAAKFYGSRRLRDDEYWMMGTKFISFDSRYWGPIHKDQIIARAYALF